MNRFFVLLFLAIWKASASAILQKDQLVKDGDTANTIHEPYVTAKSLLSERLVSRAPRNKCRPPEYHSKDAGSNKNAQVFLPLNDTLWRRMILPDNDNMDDFMVRETGEAEPVVWDLPDGWNSDGEEERFDVNTSVLREFKDFTDEELSLSASSLKGCTVLTIISCKGVYMSHWWETISFNPEFRDEEVSLDEVAKKKVLERLFQRTVIRGLLSGIRKDGDSLQVSLKLNSDSIQDDYIHAYLIRPSTHSKEDESDKDLGYREQWDKIKAVVLDILPPLMDIGRWQEVPYDVVPVGLENQLEETARGRVLFKYDPKHRVENGVAVRRTALWNEGNEIHVDEW